MKAKLFIIALLYVGLACGQPSKTEVLTLGSFHFAFHNLDVIKIDQGEQIDVLDKKHQAEIKDIVNRLAAFQPTIIVIERTPKQQGRIDSLYRAYLNGRHLLSRNEEEQIGFRLAKKMGIKKLYCADDPGSNYPKVDQLMEDAEANKKFMDFFYQHPDSSYFFHRPEVFREMEMQVFILCQTKDLKIFKIN